MKGTVVTIASLTCRVDAGGSLYECDARRRLVDGDTGESKPLAVGDEVEFELMSQGIGVITRVLPRRTKLSRAQVRGGQSDRRTEHVMVANVDQVLIVCSVRDPRLTVGLIDRYVIAAQSGGLDPAVCINKIDLAQGPAEYQDVASLYERLGFPVALTSAAQKAGLDQLRSVLAGKSTVFAGHSGVGKSSLINALQPGAGLRVAPSVLPPGQHCTARVSLIRLEAGGYVVDTPGIREFTLWDIERSDVAQFFSDIWELSHDCRMPDCSHTHEPSCAVKGAVDDGRIPAGRYESYLSILESIGDWVPPRASDVDRPQEQVVKRKRRPSRRTLRQRLKRLWREDLEEQ